MVISAGAHFINRPEKYTLESLASPTVNLRVGPDGLVLTAHKAILTRSQFFASCLEEGRFEEGLKNEICLPEEHPHNLLAILRFLYTGNALEEPWYWPNNYEGPEGERGIPAVINLLIVADKFCMEEMCFHLERLIINNFSCYTVEWKELEQVKQAGIRRPSLWQAIKSKLASALIGRGRGPDLEKLLADGLEDDIETAMWLLRETVRLVKEDREDNEQGHNVRGWD